MDDAFVIPGWVGRLAATLLALAITMLIIGLWSGASDVFEAEVLGTQVRCLRIIPGHAVCYMTSPVTQ